MVPVITASRRSDSVNANNDLNAGNLTNSGRTASKSSALLAKLLAKICDSPNQPNAAAEVAQNWESQMWAPEVKKCTSGMPFPKSVSVSGAGLEDILKKRRELAKQRFVSQRARAASV